MLGISGKGAYSRLKYESAYTGLQRVPETEIGGRSTPAAATVADLPEAENFDVEIGQRLRIDVYRSGGHGTER